MRNFANRLFDILRHNSWLTDPAFAGSVSPYRHVPGYLSASYNWLFCARCCRVLYNSWPVLSAALF